MATNVPTVLESNAYGTAFTLDTLWEQRQAQARQRATEAAARAAQALLDAADAPTMMVRVTAVQSVVLSELIGGKDIDGVVLQKGDYVLLTQQTSSSENGVWVVGATAAETRRPNGYLNATGRQFYTTDGKTRRGTMFVCDLLGSATEIRPGLSRPVMRDAQEEQTFVKGLVQAYGGVRASRLAPPTTTEDDTVTKAYIEGLSIRAASVSEPCTAEERNLTRAHIDSLNVYAQDAKRIRSDGASADTANLAYMDGLGISAKRARVISTPSLPSDVADNGAYVRNVLGIGHRSQVDVIWSTSVANLGNGLSVPLATGKRVLLVAQTNGVENGVYTVQSNGALARAPDMPDGSHCAGSCVVHSNHMYTMVCLNSYGNDMVGRDMLEWKETLVDAAGIRRELPTGARAAVAQVIATNINVTDALQTGKTLNGAVLGEGMRVLLIGQTVGTENGIWEVSLPAPHPSRDFHVCLITAANGSSKWFPSMYPFCTGERVPVIIAPVHTPASQIQHHGTCAATWLTPMWLITTRCHLNPSVHSGAMWKAS